MVFGFWILVFGFWFLDFGFWILDFGFLGFGFGIKYPAAVIYFLSISSALPSKYFLRWISQQYPSVLPIRTPGSSSRTLPITQSPLVSNPTTEVDISVGGPVGHFLAASLMQGYGWGVWIQGP